MKTTRIKLILMALILSCGLQLNAKVWRVNNTAGVSADFSTMTAAISGATAGDTLYVEGSYTSYGNITLNKKLIIIGTGYFIADNDSTQANPNASQLGTITISSGAQGSVISGIMASATTAGANTVTISTNDITISRCYLYNYPSISSSTYSGNALYISTGASNIVVEKCYIYQARYYSGSSTSNSYYTNALYIAGSNSGLMILNNVIKVGSKSSAAYYYSYAVQMATNSSAIFTNNVIIGPFQAYNSNVTNNIQILGGNYGTYITSSSYPNVTKNNIGNSTQFGTTDGNQSNVTMTNVFNYSPGSENVDNHYTLKAASPAIGAGISGEDCGIFGGIGAYKLSGIPGIPAIFNATVPATGTTSGGINVNIKAKTNK